MERLDQPCPAEMEYDSTEFVEPFLRDLTDAQNFVILYSPYLRLQVLKIFLAEIQRCIARGVRICFIIVKPKMWDIAPELLDPVVRAEYTELAAIIKMLESQGCHVNFRRHIHLKIAIFDGILMYRGSLNFFSYGKSTDSTTRHTNPAKALNAAKTYDISCACCREEFKAAKQHVQLISPETDIAGLLSTLRSGVKISQRKLAASSGIGRSNVQRAEGKKRSVGVPELARVCDVTDQAILIVPKYSVAAIKRLVEKLPIIPPDSLS